MAIPISHETFIKANAIDVGNQKIDFSYIDSAYDDYVTSPTQYNFDSLLLFIHVYTGFGNFAYNAGVIYTVDYLGEDREVYDTFYEKYFAPVGVQPVPEEYRYIQLPVGSILRPDITTTTTGWSISMDIILPPGGTIHLHSDDQGTSEVGITSTNRAYCGSLGAGRKFCPEVFPPDIRDGKWRHYTLSIDGNTVTFELAKWLDDMSGLEEEQGYKCELDMGAEVAIRIAHVASRWGSDYSPLLGVSNLTVDSGDGKLIGYPLITDPDEGSEADIYTEDGYNPDVIYHNMDNVKNLVITEDKIPPNIT